MVQIIQQMWSEVGFDVTIGQVEQADLINDFIAGKFQAATSYQFGAIDPDLNYVWWSTTTAEPVGQHRPQLPPQLRPGDRAEHAHRPPHHRPGHPGQAYQTVNQQLAKDLPYIWLEQYVFSEVAADQVQNFANPTLPERAWPVRVRRGHLRPHPDLAVEVAVAGDGSPGLTWAST